MARKIKRAKRALSFEEKASFILEKMNEHVKFYKLMHGHNAVCFTMRDIAKMTGYAASNKLLIDLYAMCDQKMMKLEVQPIVATGKADFRNRFWTHEAWRDKMTQKKLFKMEV